MSTSDPMLVSAAVLGRLLSLTDRHVRRLRKDGILPGAGAKYDLRECVPAYIAHLREGSASSSLADEKLGLVRAKRRQLELANEHRAGILIHADLVEETMMAQAAYIARAHDAAAGRLAPEMIGLTDTAVARAKILAEMREIREGIAQFSIRQADVLDRMAQEAERKEKAGKARGAK